MKIGFHKKLGTMCPTSAPCIGFFFSHHTKSLIILSSGWTSDVYTCHIMAQRVADGIWWVGANVITEEFFEGMWPLPHGVALNSYVVRGEKTAVIDLVRDGWGGASGQFLRMLESLQVKLSEIDYIVMNHMEPDHSGLLKLVQQIAPNVKIIASKKGVLLIKAFYGITENVISVKTGDSFDLGGGKVLQFVDIPNVHWPDSMVTFEPSSGVLFSSDAFGSYGTNTGQLFESLTPPRDEALWEEETLRYYANIVSPFSGQVIKTLEKLRSTPVRIIAPAHGRIWDRNPAAIVAKYERYASYGESAGEPEIAVIWGSMYGNTEAMVRSFMGALLAHGRGGVAAVRSYHLPNEHLSFALAAAYRAASLVIACPTYNYHIYAPVKQFLVACRDYHFGPKKVVFMGSYGWAEGQKQKEFDEIANSLHWDVVGKLSFNGYPKPDDIRKGEDLAKQLTEVTAVIHSKITDAEI